MIYYARISIDKTKILNYFHIIPTLPKQLKMKRQRDFILRDLLNKLLEQIR